MKEAARGSGPRGLRTGSACLIAQPDRAARKCPRARRWAVGGNTQSRGDPGRPEGPLAMGPARRSARPRREAAEEERDGEAQGHLQRSGTEICGKTPVRGGRKPVQTFLLFQKTQV